jgi:hypothetical protein
MLMSKSQEKDTTSPTERIAGFYRRYLGREPEPEGLAYWTNLYHTIGSGFVENGIANSEEAINRIINSTYRQYHGRDASPSELVSLSSIYRRQGNRALIDIIRNK